MDAINKTILDLMDKEGGPKAFAEKLDNVHAPQYFSNMKSRRTAEPSGKLILKIVEKYGPQVFLGEDVPVKEKPYISVREDLWTEIEETNKYYRTENTSFRAQLEKNSTKLFDIVDYLIRGGGTIPKQA